MRKKLVGGVATVALMATFSGKASAASHEVKPGDTLWNIATQYKTTVTKIKELNNLKSDILYPKQVLQVDGNGSAQKTTSAPTVKANSKKTNVSTSSNSGSTYTVKPGDYLIKIANAHNMSLAKLKQLNGLTSDVIRPGQVLRVQGAGGAPSAVQAPKATAAPNTGSSTSSKTAATHKVVAGDTLSRIAANYGTTVAKIKQENGLSSDLIYTGQVLRLSGNAQSASNGNTGQAVSAPKPSQTKAGNVIQTAMQYIGTKYAWGGVTPAGFDCSGFIYYAFKQAGHNISRTNTDGYYNRSHYVKSPQPGDLVFFENTYKRGISHMGIYLGGNQFIHAGDNGVEVASLNNTYWKSKFNGFKKFY